MMVPAHRFNYRNGATPLSLLQILFVISLASAFVLENSRSTHKLKFQKSHVWPLWGKLSGRDDIGELNKARTDIRNFLTQRAIQSFIFLLSHCRDSATVQWLEVSIKRSFKSYGFSTFNVLCNCTKSHKAHAIAFQAKFDCKNLENFHGTGAFNLTNYPEWDSILLELMFTPPQVVMISAKRRGQGHGGWSKDNPYLEEVCSSDL
jgi:hypothetical protein